MQSRIRKFIVTSEWEDQPFNKIEILIVQFDECGKVNLEFHVNFINFFRKKET